MKAAAEMNRGNTVGRTESSQGLVLIFQGHLNIVALLVSLQQSVYFLFKVVVDVLEYPGDCISMCTLFMQ